MNKKILIGIGIVIAIVVIIILVNNKKEPSKQVAEGSSIDVNDEAYKGKKIYVEDGDTIIEEENGSKTIETTKTLEKTDLVEATPDVQEKYTISGVTVEKFGAKTKIKGTIASTNSDTKDVSVNCKLYSTDNKVKYSTNTRLEKVKNGETRNFEIEITGDFTGCTCKAKVEFTN